MRAWVYKVNSRAFATSDGKPGWHFDRYFRGKGKNRYDMGGREWVRSPQSWQRLKQVREGDLFFCYQSDERKIYGLAHAAGNGYETLRGSGIFDSIDFDAEGLRLLEPLPVAHRETRDVFRHIGAFTVPSRGTVHSLRADECKAILRMLIRWNPGQRKVIEQFARLR